MVVIYILYYPLNKVNMPYFYIKITLFIDNFAILEYTTLLRWNWFISNNKKNEFVENWI